MTVRATRSTTEPGLALVLHEVMCDVSHHDGDGSSCSRFLKYEHVAASAFERLGGRGVTVSSVQDVAKAVTDDLAAHFERQPTYVRYGPKELAKLVRGLNPTGINIRVEPDGLGAAWADAEAALPEGWHIAALASDGADNPGWYVEARSAMVGGERVAASGPTPEAALRTLAERLPR